MIGAEEVGRVDGCLPVEPLAVVEGCFNRAARHCNQDGLRIRDVSALLADPRHLTAGLLPKICKSAADVSPSDHCDPHFSAPFVTA